MTIVKVTSLTGAGVAKNVDGVATGAAAGAGVGGGGIFGTRSSWPSRMTLGSVRQFAAWSVSTVEITAQRNTVERIS